VRIYFAPSTESPTAVFGKKLGPTLSLYKILLFHLSIIGAKGLSSYSLNKWKNSGGLVVCTFPEPQNGYTYNFRASTASVKLSCANLDDLNLLAIEWNIWMLCRATPFCPDNDMNV
jgi:hypothetical protein